MSIFDAGEWVRSRTGFNKPYWREIRGTPKEEPPKEEPPQPPQPPQPPTATTGPQPPAGIQPTPVNRQIRRKPPKPAPTQPPQPREAPPQPPQPAQPPQPPEPPQAPEQKEEDTEDANVDQEGKAKDTHIAQDMQASLQQNGYLRPEFVAVGTHMFDADKNQLVNESLEWTAFNYVKGIDENDPLELLQIQEDDIRFMQPLFMPSYVAPDPPASVQTVTRTRKRMTNTIQINGDFNPVFDGPMTGRIRMQDVANRTPYLES